MANGLFTTPEQILANRRAQAAKVIQSLNARQGQSRAQSALKGLGQMALAFGGMQQAKEEEAQLGALRTTLDSNQESAARAQPVAGSRPEVLAQHENVVAQQRKGAFANSGLDRVLQGSVRLEDTRRRNGLSPEGLLKGAQAVYAENPELALKMFTQAKAMAPEAEKTPEGKLYQIVDSQGNITGRTFVRQGESPELPEGSRLQTIGSGGKGQNIDIDVNSGSQLSAQEQLDLARDTKFAEEVGKRRAEGIATKEAEDIVVGSSAAEQIPSLLRSIDLLKEVETGGVAGLALRAKQTLGIEAANEAELTNALEKGVISQLRDVFGAQFTAKEGQWLKDIEANIGKSTEGNRRLLERGLELARLRVENGISAAIEAGDVRSRRQMEKMLGFRISPPVEEEAPSPKEGTRAANEAGDVMVFTNGAWIKQ